MVLGRQNSESINFENTLLNTTGDLMLDERRRATVVLEPGDMMNITMEDREAEAGAPKLDMTMMESRDGGIGAIREVSEHSGSVPDSASLGDKGLDQTVKK